MPRLILVLALLVLSACANRTNAPYFSAVPPTATQVDILTVTGRALNPAGKLSAARAEQLRYLTNTVSIPPTHQAGMVELSYIKPDPSRHFVISGQKPLAGAAGFARELRAELAKRPKKDREILLYVHGYNTSYSDGLFRIAQLQNDLTVPGVMMHYSWPSAASALGYSHDRDSVLFARDDLQDTLELIRRTTDAPILLVAHSMGSLLVMETLRQIEIGKPGWSKRALSGMILVAPDISVDLFRKQAERFRELPEPFAIFTSRKDPALMLSARVNGVKSRLGNLSDPLELGDLPITLIDVTEFSPGGMAGHFVPGTSPALISLLSRTLDIRNAFSRDASGRTDLFSGTVITMQKATQLILAPAAMVLTQ